jgi:hypothetical protein
VFRVASRRGVDLVSEIVGFPCDLDDLDEHVPLVSRVGPDDFHAHELWAETIAATPPPRLRGLRRHAVRALAAQGDLARAGAVALAGKDWPLLADVAGQLVVATGWSTSSGPTSTRRQERGTSG